MTDRPEASPWLRLLGGLFVSASLAFSPLVLAQEESDDEATDEVEETEEIVVTGSRLKRDTYSSIAPLQIISASVSREVGLIDAADILQESTAAAGQQVDLTFSGFVLDNGPGATTIDLRGLGQARTLVLINGRRMAPAGVEGAPFAPNINLVPGSMVQQYDLLLDGASSVYGSDAIAGVANVILRKDFDGFEIEGYSRVPHHDNGLENTLSVAWGKNFDRGFIGVGYEYFDSEKVAFEDRPWTAGCERHHEIDENGEFRSDERFYSDVYGMEWDDCRLGSLAARIFQFDLRSGSIYYTPGQSNGGWGNFSESSDLGFGIDSNQDGVADLSFRDYDLNGKPSNQNATLFPELQTQSFMAYGEYTFSGEANITPYFEVLYSDQEFVSDFGAIQFFPTVPADSPLNLCNRNAPGGIDCGLAQDDLYRNPGYVASFQQNFGGFCASIGLTPDQCIPDTFGFITGGVESTAVQPIVSVAGDRNTNSIEGDQIRVVGGVRGDLPFMTAGSLDNWTFDAYYSYSKSDATSSRPGIRDDRIDLALGVFSSTNTPCENDLGVELAADAAPGCVPVDMFAPSLYPVGVVTGDFATQAERDYLFDSRDFATEYEQAVGSLYATGDIFELPGGPVAFGIGVETRRDEINSLPDQVADEGLLFGFFADGGAVGDKTTNEAFAEIEMPLMAGTPGVQELTVNASSRFTDDEIYGGNWTWSGKLGYRPTDALLLRGTFGTAFRAPNLRELYLRDQTSFNNGLFDPCFVPEEAINDVTGEYDPTLDDREPEVFANCAANGVDATQAVGFGRQIYSAEVATGGSLTLAPEKSESWSAGLSWDQPFTNAFGLNVSATYYEVEVRNTIIEPSSQFIVNDCYTSLTGNSAFCDRITRDLSDPTAPFIDLIDAGFINRDSETARGIDINVAFDDTFTVFNRPIDLGLDIVANRQLERDTLFVDDEGNEDADSFVGEWGFPEWRVQSYLRLDYSDFRFVYEMRYTSSVIQDPDGVDEFDEAITGGSDTCVGPPDDVLCRDFADTGNYFLHNVSLYYYGDRWTFGGGIRNLLDEKPPIVDGTEVQSINNTPIGYGYDLRGRTYFLNVAVNFGGDM
jgi:iron complex outermembrane receptor protein